MINNLNRCALGLFVKCPHAEIIESLGIAKIDFAVIDMEHTPLSPRDLYPLVLAAELRKLKLVVRIPQNLETYFKWCKDLKIISIQVPHVETREDVIYAIKHSNFSPQGERGLCRFVRAADFSGLSKDEYITAAKNSNQLILQIESKRAIDNLDQIISEVPFGTSLFIGPYDLSQSLGKPGNIWDPLVIKTMEDIISRCSAKGVGVGTFTDTLEGINFWSKKNIAFLQYASDLNLLIQASSFLMKTVKDATLHPRYQKSKKKNFSLI
jgi:4-hydroxy-2-oxoheptanedioate aldolase